MNTRSTEFWECGLRVRISRAQWEMKIIFLRLLRGGGEDGDSWGGVAEGNNKNN